MNSPYINTILHTNIVLHPYQMDNKIYINLKNNLQSLKDKCFSKYGYIVKLIEIVDYKDGVVEAENTESAASFDIDFSCRICAPLKNTQIICEIDRINKLLITAVNGPILAIITNDRVNSSVFFKDNNNNIRYWQGGQSNTLQSHDFIIVTIQSISFKEGDEKMKIIGFIDRMATEEEKKQYYVDLYKDIDELVNYEDYISKYQEKIVTEEDTDELSATS